MEIQLWREILNPYELAVKEVTTKFNHLIKEHKDKGIYCPIERVEGRVKTIASILDKCQKKKIAPERIEDRIVDLTGWWRLSAIGTTWMSNRSATISAR